MNFSVVRRNRIRQRIGSVKKLSFVNYYLIARCITLDRLAIEVSVPLEPRHLAQLLTLAQRECRYPAWPSVGS